MSLAAAKQSQKKILHLPFSQGLFKWHQYVVVGRHNPTEAMPEPTVYRMKVWAPDSVRAKSKFWCVAATKGTSGHSRQGLAALGRLPGKSSFSLQAVQSRLP